MVPGQIERNIRRGLTAVALMAMSAGLLIGCEPARTPVVPPTTPLVAPTATPEGFTGGQGGGQTAPEVSTDVAATKVIATAVQKATNEAPTPAPTPGIEANSIIPPATDAEKKLPFRFISVSKEQWANVESGLTDLNEQIKTATSQEDVLEIFSKIREQHKAVFDQDRKFDTTWNMPVIKIKNGPEYTATRGIWGYFFKQDEITDYNKPKSVYKLWNFYPTSDKTLILFDETKYLSQKESDGTLTFGLVQLEQYPTTNSFDTIVKDAQQQTALRYAASSDPVLKQFGNDLAVSLKAGRTKEIFYFERESPPSLGGKIKAPSYQYSTMGQTYDLSSADNIVTFITISDSLPKGQDEFACPKQVIPTLSDDTKTRFDRLGTQIFDSFFQTNLGIMILRKTGDSAYSSLPKSFDNGSIKIQQLFNK